MKNTAIDEDAVTRVKGYRFFMIFLSDGVLASSFEGNGEFKSFMPVGAPLTTYIFVKIVNAGNQGDGVFVITDIFI